MKKISLFLFFLLFVLGCDPTEDKQNQGDSGSTDTSDTGSDVQKIDDTSKSPDVGSDMQADTATDTSDKDMGSGDALAIVGERCEPKNRIGIVTVKRSRQVDVYGLIHDAPSPLISDPTSADSQCDFHSFVSLAPCQQCEENEICNAAGRCLPLPKILPDAQIEIANEVDSRIITTNNGGLSDSVALDGDTFSMEVSWAGQKIIVPKIQIPAALDGLEGKLEGSYDKPEGLEFKWEPPSEPARVFTRVPINHHVNDPTFVECDVDAASGSLKIDGQMLEPLAVSTGLEFQTIEHSRFAAAQTPQGCVEFRFQSSTFPPLN